MPRVRGRISWRECRELSRRFQLRLRLQPVKTPLQCFARATAYEEIASHLELDWTEDPTERAEGNELRDNYYRLAQRWRREGQRLVRHGANSQSDLY